MPDFGPDGDPWFQAGREEPPSVFEGMSEMEQDRNWWKGEAASLKRSLVVERNNVVSRDREIEGLRRCLSGSHTPGFHTWVSELAEDVLCLHCGYMIIKAKEN
jgi:hypothetical protein